MTDTKSTPETFTDQFPKAAAQSLLKMAEADFPDPKDEVHPLEEDDLAEYFDVIPPPSLEELIQSISSLEERLYQFEDLAQQVKDLEKRLNAIEPLVR